LLHKVLFWLPEVAGERGLELAIYLAQKTRAYLLVLLVIDDRLCHYGEVDPLASTRSRETFVTYVLEEGLKEAQKKQKDLKRRLSNAGLFYRICLKCGSPIEALLETARTEGVDIILLERKALHRRAYKKLLHKAPANLLFV